MQEEMAQNTFTLGESWVCYIVAWGFSVPHMRVHCDGSPYHTHETLPHHWKLASQQTHLPLATVGNPRKRVNKDCDPGDSAPATAAAGILSHQDVCPECTKHWLRHLQFPARAMCWLLRAPDNRFLHTLDSLSQWPRSACLFHSAQAATLPEFYAPLTNCFVHRWFCVVHGPKPPMHHHNWLSFGKLQDTERFFIPCPCHV
jgi:hypothetical protein